MWCWPCSLVRNPARKTDKKTRQESSARKYNKQVLRREQILEFCVEPKSLFDILQHLGLKNRENLMEVYINPMIGAGALAMTEPDNPTSRNQMYVAVREDMDTCNSKWLCCLNNKTRSDSENARPLYYVGNEDSLACLTQRMYYSETKPTAFCHSKGLLAWMKEGVYSNRLEIIPGI